MTSCNMQMSLVLPGGEGDDAPPLPEEEQTD